MKTDNSDMKAGLKSRATKWCTGASCPKEMGAGGLKRDGHILADGKTQRGGCAVREGEVET
jgi:hypothetical protein